MLTLSLVISALCAASCTDRNPVAGPHVAPENAGGGGRFVATLVCSVDVKAGSTACRSAQAPPNAPSAARLMILEGAGNMVQLSGDVYTPADSTYTLDVRIVNTLGTAIGTYDGATATGIKAFLPIGVMAYEREPGDLTAPYVDSISMLLAIPDQLARARNPDGRIAFTGPSQPYWDYAGKLAPGDSSAPRQWKFALDPSVAFFRFAVGIFAAVPGETEVPAQIPGESTTVPIRYLRPENLRDCTPVSWIPRCIPDAIAVEFHDAATQTERQAAVASVGTYEGGILDQYFVRIPLDSSLAVMGNALERLRQLPQVKAARPYFPLPIDFDYLRPTDGTDWTTWQVRDSAADGHNWAQEAISAPLAWGCQTGATAGSVAIVDSDFHLLPDELQPNLMGQNAGVGQLTSSVDTLDHGTKLSGIIAAAANNNAYMAGMLWSAPVSVYETAIVDNAGQVERYYPGGPAITAGERGLSLMADAVRSGATVVNLSWGMGKVSWKRWAASMRYADSSMYDPSTQSNPTRIHQRDSMMAVVGERISGTLRRLKAEGYNPLLVTTSGNDGWNVTWDPYKRFASDVTGNVIIVGSAEDAGNGRLAASSFSNFGDLVDVVAPGRNIWTLNRNGPVRVAGTSYSAPFVTGVAGLLIGFDPRLANRGDSLKQLIVDGAIAGRRRVVNGPVTSDSLPVLHAYEALRGAARRNGAPVCGNRMWINDRTVTVQRDSATNRTESIYTVSSTHSGFGVNPLHGGKRIVLRNGSGENLVYTWSSQQLWQPATLTPSDTAFFSRESSGAWRSRDAWSHGADTIARATSNGTLSTYRFDVTVQPRGGISDTIAKIPAPVTNNTGTLCIREFLSADPAGSISSTARIDFLKDSLVGVWTAQPCTHRTGEAEFKRTPSRRPAYSPLGDRVLVFISYAEEAVVPESWVPCKRTVTITDGPTTAYFTAVERCRNAVALVGTAETQAWDVDIREIRPAAKIWEVAERNASAASIDERGREVSVELEKVTSRSEYTWAIDGAGFGTLTRVDKGTTRDCVSQFRNLATGAVITSAPACSRQNGSTIFAPNVRPGSL